MAYRADIEIAVRGAQELKRLQNEISATSKLVDGLNNYLENIGSGGVVRSINNLKTVVGDAAAAFDRVALNTEEAVIAARKYVTATNELNSELRERAALLKTVNEEERKNKLARAGIRETTQYAGPIGPGPVSPVDSLVGQKSPVAERIQRTIRARQDELDLQQALLRLEEKSAAELNKKVQSQEALVQGTREVVTLLDQQAQRQKFLAGASGTAMQGPLAGPGAMGFPVALPLSKAEQKALETESQKLRILERMAATRQQLSGLTANLQRLEQNSAVAIADAERAQLKLNAAKAKELQLVEQTAAIRNKEAISSAAARQRLADDAARRRLMQDAGFGVQGPALPPGQQAPARGRNRFAGRIGGAISGAAIGGAFPLLFGQSGGAAAGGAIGGLTGGLLGPGGSFAGSLIGTLLGDIASKGNVVKKLGEDIGFSAEQTHTLETAFKQAGREFDKFEAAVQNIRGLGLDIEAQAESIKLVSTLTEKYGGSIDKVTNAFTSALEAGKVTQATLNQLTSQGIPIQDALAQKYNVSRSALLQMTKDGKVSVQDLTDALIDVGNKGVQATTKFNNGFTQLNTATKDLGGAFQQLGGAIVTALSPALEWLAGKIAGIISLASQGIQAVARMLSGGTQVDVRASAMAGAQLVKEFPELSSQRFGGRAGKPMVQNGTLAVGATGSLTQEQRARYDQLRNKAITTIEKPTPIKRIDVSSLGQLPPSGAGKSSGIDKAARDAARLAEQRKKQLEIAARLAVETDTQVKKAVALTREEELQAELDQQRMERMTKYETLYRQALSNAEIDYLLTAQLNELTAADLEYKKQLKDIQLQQSASLQEADPLGTAQEEINLLAAKLTGKEKEYIYQQKIDALVNKGATLNDARAQVDTVTALNEKLNERLRLEQLLETVGQGVGDTLLNVFDALISRTENFNDVLRNTLAGLGRMLMMAGLNALAGSDGKGVLSFLGFGTRASGGPVTSQQPYLIGERGPELFVPGTGGSVVPTSDLRSAMGSSSTTVLNMSFETTSINGVEYVSREQLEIAMASTRRQAANDGANRGMSMTLDKLQQSPSTRNRVGLR